MIDQLSKLLSPSLSSTLALSGIKKLNPKMNDFVVQALSLGYTSDNLINFLRDRLESPQTKSRRAKQELIGTGMIRPEEEVNLKGLERADKLTSALSVGASLVPGARLAMGALSPFQEKEVPKQDSLDVLSIAKSSLASNPGFSDFLQKLVSAENSPGDISAFLKSKKASSAQRQLVSDIEKQTGVPFEVILEKLFYKDRVVPETQNKPYQGPQGAPVSQDLVAQLLGGLQGLRDDLRPYL